MNKWLALVCVFIVGIILGAVGAHRGGYASGAEKMRTTIALSLVESHRQHDQSCREYLAPSKKNNPELVPECAPEVRDLLDDQVMWDAAVANSTGI